MTPAETLRAAATRLRELAPQGRGPRRTSSMPFTRSAETAVGVGGPVSVVDTKTLKVRTVDEAEAA